MAKRGGKRRDPAREKFCKRITNHTSTRLGESLGPLCDLLNADQLWKAVYERP
jgi:hypothetical protein